MIGQLKSTGDSGRAQDYNFQDGSYDGRNDNSKTNGMK